MDKKAQQLRVFDDLKSDEFVVDDLFDFSEGEFENNFLETVEDQRDDEAYYVPISTLGNGEKTEDKCFNSVSSSELGIPVDDVADLEWLSHFVEDSFPSYSVPFQVKPTQKVATNFTKKPVFETPVWSCNQTGVCGARQPRRCSHCGVHSTPQWRGGPMGPKTLCNACGVRYKSGRLLPEYRPACSPTFSSEVHSNNHRKILEMRRKKEVGTVSSPQSHVG